MAVKSYSVILNKKIGEFKKVINVDSDKSISIRAFLISSISQGISKISNVLLSDDVFSTIKSLKKLNCKIVKTGKNVVVDAVAGTGKTTLILSLAKELIHKNILQMTYNKSLKFEVREKIKEQLIISDNPIR